jgi:hypothetical protein
MPPEAHPDHVDEQYEAYCAQALQFGVLAVVRVESVVDIICIAHGVVPKVLSQHTAEITIIQSMLQRNQQSSLV